MEDNNRQLYPITFLEDTHEEPWGLITYQVADLGFADSMVAEGWFGGNTLSELMGTYMERVTGDDAFEYYGLQFPLLVKTIKTALRQPLQVNVPDDIAQERYDSFGKTALWYVKEAGPDAYIYLGLKRNVEPADFYRRCLEGTVDDVLNKIHPKAGDSFLITPGTLHAAGPGLTILEIGECSELSLDIPTMLEEAFDLIDFSKYSSLPLNSGNLLARCPEFTVTRYDLRNPLHIFSEQPGGFAIYHCLSGEAVIHVPSEPGGQNGWYVRNGRSILVPSEVHDFMLSPTVEGTVVLEALVEKRTDPDSYIGSGQEGNTPDPHIRKWN